MTVWRRRRIDALILRAQRGGFTRKSNQKVISLRLLWCPSKKDRVILLLASFRLDTRKLVVSICSVRYVRVERQSLPEMVFLSVVGTVIDVEMSIRRLEGSDQQCSTQRNCGEPWHRQILSEPRWTGQSAEIRSHGLLLCSR